MGLCSSQKIFNISTYYSMGLHIVLPYLGGGLFPATIYVAALQYRPYLGKTHKKKDSWQSRTAQ